MIPGEYILASEDIVCNENKQAIKLKVLNSSDRAVQVGSHFHFYEVNSALQMDREKAYGRRLDILAGGTIRFEPGDEKEVSLIEIGGNKEVYGLNDKVNGKLK